MADSFPSLGSYAQSLQNLNEAVIPSAEGPDEPIRNGRYHHKIENVDVLFDKLEDALIAEIERWPVVVGCMAWMTNGGILRALATRGAVSMIVNKEDFLRPDKGNWSERRIKEMYAAIPGINRYVVGRAYSFACDPVTAAVRCIGIRDERKNVPPRMHHKFMVFCDAEAKETIRVDQPGAEAFEFDDGGKATPRAVWTGSFNATFNGTQSLENAVILRGFDYAYPFFCEWAALLGISEPLNWESPYVAPEYRIGT
jgi:hypothetical protein